MNASIGAKLVEFALRRPVTICMVFVSMLLLGIISSRLLPLEKLPGIDIPELYVHVPYPNSTPAEVERLITRPIEEALATISGQQRLNSVSRENGADIAIEFNWEANINAKSIEAREKIDAIRHLLPKDVERVLVFQFNTNDMPIFKLRISSERDLSMAYDLLDRQLKRQIERVPGVSKVELYGVDKKQISVRLNTNKINAMGLDPQAIANRLLKDNFSRTAGHFYQGQQKYIVNPIGEFHSLEEIQSLIIKPGVRLADIAEVAYELPEMEEGRHLDQTYAIGMDIFKESNANLVEVAGRVLEVMDQVGQNPQFNGINLFLMDNVADGVTQSLSDLLEAGLLGALLSLIVLYLFLRHAMITFIVVLSVPFAICITLGVMYFFGYSLNILSMMGLMLAVGMLVDNAVVITESIFKERSDNPDADLMESTKAGVNKVSLAVIAGTLTTAIVFLPNIVGKKVELTIFLEHVAIAICIPLLASLVIAQTLIPLLTTKVKITPKPKKQAPGKLSRFYRISLNWSQTHPKLSGLLALVILASTALPMGVITSDEDNNGDNDRIVIRYHLDNEYTLDEAKKIVDKMENYLYANKEAFQIDSVYSYYSPNRITSSLLLKDGQPYSLNELQKRIKKDMPSFVRARPEFGWNSGSGGGVRIHLKGNSTQVLMELAQQVVPALENIKGLTDVRADVSEQQQELQIIIDRTKAHRFGLSTDQVSAALALALRGQNLRTFRHDPSGELDIRLSQEKDYRHSLEKLRNLAIIRQGDKILTLENLAEIKRVPRMTEIQRYYRQTALVIGANMDEISLEQAKDKITEVMNAFALPAGYSWSLDGSFRRQGESENIMQINMLLAVCMIYIVMAALFESLLLPTAVITSLLFSITGVFWALMVTGNNMSIMAMIGILILMGIVVNNGIVMVDRINQLIEDGIAEKAAVLQGAMDRVKPILMTVATTVLGLLPLAIGNTSVGGDGPSYSPMAIAIIGGLVFSTLTSLYLVPLAYTGLLSLRRKTRTMLAHSAYLTSKVIRP